MKKLFLLDAMALIYRAFYALNKKPHINSKGLNTSAIVGFANTLYDVLKNEKPDYIGVAFDSHGPTLRHDGFAAYKANRDATPQEIIDSIPYIKELLYAFRIPVLELQGYEADDIIGTLSVEADKAGYEVYMMSSDKDLGQLITDNVKMYRPGVFGNKAEIWGKAEVCAKFGIENCEQIIDLLGLWGDASDNIPGVPGIGEVTGKKLLKEFGSMSNIYANIDSIKPESLRLKLVNNEELAWKSKELATIMLDVPVEFNPETLKKESPDESRLRAILDELEFRGFAKRVFTDLSTTKIEEANLSTSSVIAQTPRHTSTDIDFGLFGNMDNGDIDQIVISDNRKSAKTVEHDYKVVKGIVEIESLVSYLLSFDAIAFDTETTSLESREAELVSISFAVKEHEAFVVIFDKNRNKTLETLELLKPIFDNETVQKVGQNLKYDISVLQNYDIEIKGKLFDTMIAHYLFEPEMRSGMDYMADVYLGYRTISIDTLIGKKSSGNQGNMRDVPEELLVEYSAEDADITLQLRNLFVTKLEGLEQLFYDIEMPLVRVLENMEREGINLDIAFLKTLSTAIDEDILQKEKIIYDKADSVFNIASPKQLGIVLFEKLKIVDKPKKTKSGQYATGEEELMKLEKKHEIIKDILDYRTLAKLKSTYIDSLPLLVDKGDNRIHTSFNQTVTSTGRLSSTNPNLQNIPIRTERGREIRRAFIPRNENYILMAADYSQVELRIIAHLSKDKAMIDAFNSGVDIHTATAAKVYGVEINQVTREMRRQAKSINFGIIYGISAFSLSEDLGISRKDAAEIIENYFHAYPGLREYVNSQIMFAREHGYVETMFGRRRYLRDISSPNSNMRSFAERNTVNAPIQGSSADMIKIAMVGIYNEFKQQGLNSKMVLQVHDELVFDVEKSEALIVKSIVEKQMIKAVILSVPVLVDVNTGNNWLEAH